MANAYCMIRQTARGEAMLARPAVLCYVLCGSSEDRAGPNIGSTD
jgi:hypothetical protein